MYNVYSFIYEYDKKGKLLKCDESSIRLEKTFDLSYEDIDKSKKIMKEISSEIFSIKYKGKIHKKFYAIDAELHLTVGNSYDVWSFVISNSHIF